MSRSSEVSKRLYPGKSYGDLSPQQKQQVSRTIKEAEQSKQRKSSGRSSQPKQIVYDPSKSGLVRSPDTGLLIPKSVQENKPRTIVVGVTRTPSGVIQTQENLSRNMGRGQARQLSNAIQRYNKELRNAQQAYQVALRNAQRQAAVRNVALYSGPGGAQLRALEDAQRLTRELGRRIPFNETTINNLRELLRLTKKGSIAQITTLSDKKGFVFQQGNEAKVFTSNGVIRAATASEKRKLKFSKLTDRERNIELTREASVEGRLGEAMARGIVGSAVLGAFGAGKSFVEAFLKPGETLRNIRTFARQIWNEPLEVARAEGQRLLLDPAGVIAEYFTFSRLMSGTMKVARRSPVGRYVNEELFIRSQPKELRPFVRQIIKSSRVQERLNPYKVKDIKKVDFLEVLELNKVEARALKKALQKTDSVVFGSAASRTLSRKKTSVPKDVDLATRNKTKFYNKFLNSLPAKIRKDYFVKGEKLFHRTRGALLDVKPLNRLYPDKSLFRRKGFLPVVGYVKTIGIGKGSVLPGIKRKLKTARLEFPTQKIVKVEGIKMVGFGEQTVRKGLGTLQVLLEKNARRAKDPQSFVQSLQIQIAGLKASRPKTKLGKSRKASRIKKLETAYRILTSKEFIKLLDSKVPGLSKEYPLLAKLNIPKLRKVKPLTKKQVDDIVSKTSSASLSGRESKKKVSSSKSSSKKKVVKKPVSVSSKELFKPKFIKETITKKKLGFEDYSLESQRFGRKIIDTQAKTEWALLEARFGSKINKYKKKWFADRKKDLFKEYFGNGKSKIITETRLRKIKNKVSSSLSSKLPSKKLYSYLPKSFLRSKLFSKPPSSTPSRVRSKTTSRVASKTPSRTPSKLPSRVPSRTPSRTTSKTPSRVPSKTPSRIMRITPSKLSSYVSTFPSRLKAVPPGPTPAVIQKILRKKKVYKKDKKELENYVKETKVKYRPSLAAIIYDITGYSVPKSVTGFEIRPIIKAVKKARGKK